MRRVKGPHEWTAPRIAVFCAVLVYLLLFLVAPLGALAVEIAGQGLFAIGRALVTPEALDGLLSTAILTVIAIVVNAVFGVAAGIVLARQKFFGRRLVDGLIEMPLAISPVMIGLAFILVFGRGGWLEPALEYVDLKIVFSFPGMLLATLFVTLPFTAREVIGVLREIGPSEEEAAMTLGASRWQTFRMVTLPNIRAALSCGITLTAARSLGEFGAVLVIGGAIAGHTQTATTYIYSATEERQDAGAFGMSAVLALLSIALLLALNLFKKRSAERDRR